MSLHQRKCPNHWHQWVQVAELAGYVNATMAQSTTPVLWRCYYCGLQVWR
jgi:hypothetical protein